MPIITYYNFSYKLIIAIKLMWQTLELEETLIIYFGTSRAIYSIIHTAIINRFHIRGNVKIILKLIAKWIAQPEGLVPPNQLE